MFFDSKQSATFAMKDFGSLVVGVLLLMSMLHLASARRDSDPSRLKTRLNFLPAIRYRDLSEKACFTPNATDGMYVAVPEQLFRRGKACNKKLRVQCAEPYQDLGGPGNVCQNKKTFEVTVIDQVLYEPLDDDLFHLSEKAFWAMANPGHEVPNLLKRVTPMAPSGQFFNWGNYGDSRKRWRSELAKRSTGSRPSGTAKHQFSCRTPKEAPPKWTNRREAN